VTVTWRERPFAPAPGTPVCRADADDFAREVLFGDGKDAFNLLVIRRGGTVRAYRNICPHFNVQLNAAPGEFYCYGEHLMCAHHSSMFRIADGFCEDGPCAGASLEAVAVVVVDGQVRIAG
jgi:nitrite reductase/ring-hydroxylating ferredoxin subunit